LIQAAVGYICNECIKTCSEIIQRALPSANATPERRCGECGHDGRFFKNGRCHATAE
jgi:DNA-directed RNA polymerase subunit RPC12/RpoP